MHLTKRLRIRRERGSVMVLAAAAMFPIVYLAAFAIDVPHWFDYSRNLQNRADAAALAAGNAFGTTCFAGGTPGTTGNGAQSVVGKWAQLYSGAGVNEPSGRLPYSDAAVSAATTAAAGTGNGPGTGWPVATRGYLNNTLPASPVLSPLTLKLGSLNDYWLVLNGRNYAENGGTSFSMNAAGSGATFCNSDPTWDLTDPDRATAGPAGAFVDVKVSQRRLPLFFPLIGGRPTLHAHARVQLQGEASSPSEPIAVSDNGFTPCVSVDFVNASTNAVIQTVTLTKQPQVNQTDPVQWDNSAAPASFTMPASANVYLQPYLNNCNGAGTHYDADTNTGMLYINNHPATDPTVGAGQAPQITTGGVALQGTCTSSTQYFAVGACTVTINGYIKFNPGINKNDIKVFAYDRSWDNVNNVYTTILIGNSQGMTQDSGDPTHWSESFTIPDSSGMHQIEIRWRQESGSVGGTTCGNGNGNNPPACTGTFGIQAQTFDACNGCDQPDDSGPIIFARISEGISNDVNTFAGGSTHNVVVTLKLAGLSVAQGGDPATVLRFPTSGNHQTGLIDCGQGSGTSADASVVYYGCGPQNPDFTLNPLFVNTRNTCGTPPGPPWPNGNQQDCVQTTPGTRRQGIICPLVQRITKVPPPPGGACNNNSVGTCPHNYWNATDNYSPPAGDPRALTMIVTSAADFGSVAGSPQGWVPIRRFATFYITGWDNNIKPQCNDNEAFPLKGKQNNQNAAVWGHWINYLDTAGTGNNQNCPLASVQPINCVPVLTR